MGEKAEIYALCDPETGEVRYIGKAKDSQKRLKGHLLETRRKSPLYDWIASLRAKGSTPALSVLMVAWDWQEAEKQMIAQHRQTSRLLNLADGGDEPKCSKEQRAINGRNNSRKIHSDPTAKAVWRAKQALGQALKRGDLSDTVKVKMRHAAALYPHLFGNWANI